MNDSVVIQNECDDKANNQTLKKHVEILLENTTSQLTNGDLQHTTVNNSIYGNNMFVSNNDSDLASEIVISDTSVNNVIENTDCSNVIINSDLNKNSNNLTTHQTTNSLAHNNDSKIHNPKKYGKFRILVNNDELNSINTDQNENVIHQNGFIECEYTNDGVSANNEVNLSSECQSTTVEIKVKRRGRPKKNPDNNSNKTTKTVNCETLQKTDSPSRRRSTRLRNLEDKKDTDEQDSSNLNSQSDTIENNFVKNDSSHFISKPLDPSSENTQANSFSDSVNIKEESNENKPNKVKKKSKHKNKSKSPKLKTKSKKERTKSKSSKINKENDHNSGKNADLDSANESFTLPLPPNTQANENNTSTQFTSPSKTDSDESTSRPEKVKSRWRRNSELENNISCVTKNSTIVSDKLKSEDSEQEKTVNNILKNCTNEICNEPLPHFESIGENIFLFERKKSKSKKETKKMVCDCILTKEERGRGLMGCGEDCLNRMLMIECGSRCPLGDHCSNKRFQKKQYSKVEPFKTAKKGWGLKALETIPPYTFIMEYVGEVIDPFDFHERVEKYAKQKLEHHYFMALKSDEIIDATCKGNITRFVNHSCEPNSETQKWTVNGELRIGFFTIKQVNAGEEITFDYQFQRYGKKAQKCYCQSESCRGYIGSGENANILTDGSKIPKPSQKIEELDSEEEEFLEDVGLDEEIDTLVENGGLRNRQQVIVVSRLMLRAEKCDLRLKLIDIIMSTIEIAYLRLFIDYHGLQLLWSWMVEAEDIELKARLLELLEILPIPNKTMLMDCKVYSVVERWAHKDSPESQQYLNIEDEANKECSKADIVNDKEGSTSSSQTDKDIKESSIEETASEIIPESTDSQNQNDSNTESITNMEKKITDLSKLSGKVVIKSKAKSANEIVPNIAPKSKSNVTIGYLAQKLLTHWKDLKEVFRIPRLERQKRHDDEVEADRRTKEEEERRAKGLPIISEKRPVDDKDYTIAGILGNKRRCLKSLTDANKETNKRNNTPQFLINANNNNSNPNALKLSKEEYRKLFEYNVAHNDYTEALKKYQEDLAIYRSQFVQQQQILQQFQVMQQTEPTITGLNDFYQYSNSNDITSNPYFDQYMYSAPDLANPITAKSLPDQSSNTYYDNISNANADLTIQSESDEINYIEMNLKDLVPKYSSPLVVLSNHLLDQNATEHKLSSYAIDNVDFTQVKYDSDNFIESMEKKMFEEMYPPAGIFYITKNGNTYFISFPDDISSVINVKENVTEPLSLSYTEKLTEETLPYSWKSFNLKGHYYYYNKRRQIKQWHPPQDSQVEPFENPHLDEFYSTCDISQPSSTSSPVSNKKFSSDKDKDSDISHEELEDLKRKNARRVQEQFRNKISQFVVKCLNPYMKTSCTKGRIVNNSDFKYLARKLTHSVVAKEMKQCKHIEDLACSESVKHKTKEYVKRYMARFGPVYKADALLMDKSYSSPNN